MEIKNIADSITCIKNMLCQLFTEKLPILTKNDTEENRIIFKSKYDCSLEIYLSSTLFDNKLSFAIDPKGTKGIDTSIEFQKINDEFFELVKEMILESDLFMQNKEGLADVELQRARSAHISATGSIVEKFIKLRKGY